LGNAVFAGEAGDLTDMETAQLNSYLWLLFRHRDMAFYQYERGLLSEERLRSATRPMTARLIYPFVQDEWEWRKANFAPEYQNYVDGVIADQP
jgi:hypothetical protein